MKQKSVDVENVHINTCTCNSICFLSGKDKLPDASIIPVLADTLCAACQVKNDDPECIKIHCLKKILVLS